MLRLIFWLFVFGLIFRVVFSFLLPIFRMSTAASSQVRKMQEQMREMERQMQEKERQQAEARSRKKVGKEGDYIDYEELS